MNTPVAHTIHWPEVAAMALIIAFTLIALWLFLRHRQDPVERAFRELQERRRRDGEWLNRQRPEPRRRR